MAFTSVPALGQSRAFGGLAADHGEKDIVSAFNTDTGQIAFGTAVKQDTAVAAGAKNMGSSGDTVKGIATFSYMHAPGTFGDLGTSGVLANGDLRIMRKGRVWAECDPTLADGVTAFSVVPGVTRAYVRYGAGAAAGNTQLGALTSSAGDTTNALDCTRQIVFVSPVITAPDGSLIAEVEVDFTNRNS